MLCVPHAHKFVVINIFGTLAVPNLPRCGFPSSLLIRDDARTQQHRRSSVGPGKTFAEKVATFLFYFRALDPQLSPKLSLESLPRRRFFLVRLWPGKKKSKTSVKNRRAGPKNRRGCVGAAVLRGPRCPRALIWPRAVSVVQSVRFSPTRFFFACAGPQLSRNFRLAHLPGNFRKNFRESLAWAKSSGHVPSCTNRAR